MKYSRRVFSIVATLLLAGCGTTVENAKKSPSLSARISSATIVYVNAGLPSEKVKPPSLLFAGPSMLGVLATKGTFLDYAKANQHAGEVGTHFLRALPAELQQAGVQLQYTTAISAKRPSTVSDIQLLLDKRPLTSNIIIVQVVEASMKCALECFAFKLDVQLYTPDLSTSLWSATIETEPRGSIFHDFSAPGRGVANALIKQLKSDGVI